MINESGDCIRRQSIETDSCDLFHSWPILEIPSLMLPSCLFSPDNPRAFQANPNLAVSVCNQQTQQLKKSSEEKNSMLLSPIKTSSSSDVPADKQNLLPLP